MLSLEGQQLGNYDVIRRIRVGGMGAVYEGRQRTAFDRRVAIKVILGNYASDRDMRRRFAREARTIARLHHPHILPLIEFGDEKGVLYLVMPFIDGGTLTSYLRRTLPGLEEVAAIYEQLLDAVEYAHDAGLIHRDIKSSNVLLEQRRNASPYVYLADFGLVRTSRLAEQSQAGKPIPLDQVPGTPHYMAPEQTRGIITPKTDIYALGVLLYQMLTGELPYNDDDDVRVIEMHLQDPIPSPCDHDASIPLELGEVVRTAMAKRPEARFRNVAALRTAFLAAIKGPATSEPELHEILDVPDKEPPLETFYAVPRRSKTTPLDLHEASTLPETAARSMAAPETRKPSPKQSPHLAAPTTRRVRREAAPITLRAPQQRITDTVRQRQRITEEPIRRKRKPHNRWILAAMIVPAILLLLAIMPHVLGISFFPAGFPVFGTDPVATIYVTAQTKTLQGKYVLTASPQIKAPDLVTHTIPDRTVQSSASNNNTVKTTGTRVTGQQAHGTVTFINNGNNTVTLPQGLILTSNSGVRVQLIDSIDVPSQQDGNGRASAPAVAVDPGDNGNIPAHSLDGPCCNNANMSVKNSSSFTGGVTGPTVRVVAQSDLDGVQSALAPQLQQQVKQQLQQLLTADEVIAVQPTYSITATPSSPVGAQVDQVQVTIQVAGSVIVYNRAIVNRIASQLLTKQAIQTLNSNYQMQGDATIAPAPTIEQGQGGVIYISISAHAIWMYNLTQQQIKQWQQSIKGATSAAALAYLNAQPGIAAVQIELPFGTDHLPTIIDQIKIIPISR